MKNYLISHAPELLEGKAKSSLGRKKGNKLGGLEFRGEKKSQNLCKVLAATL